LNVKIVPNDIFSSADKVQGSLCCHPVVGVGFDVKVGIDVIPTSLLIRTPIPT